MKRFINLGIVSWAIVAFLVVGMSQWEALAGKIYWVDPDANVIQRSNLDGSGLQTLLGAAGPIDIALDVAAGKMYWTDLGADSVQRANLNGSGVETLVSGLLGPRGIALDLTVTTYDAWTSRSVDFPPHEPIHNCVRLTDNTISTDVCGDSGPLFKFPVLAVPGVDLWIGQVPCQGQNLFFVGTSLDGELFPLGKKAIGASIIGLSQGTTLGLEGLENANCSTLALNEDNTYATALSTGSQAVGELGSLLDDDKPALEIGPPGNAQTVANKTYEIWFSGSLGVPGAFPQSDCWHFTSTTMTTDQCGDSGPLVEFPLFGVPGMSLWIGQVPCQGQNLVFFGTSYDGAIFPFGGNVVSATGIGLTLGLTLAAEGFENPSCSTVP